MSWRARLLLTPFAAAAGWACSPAPAPSAPTVAVTVLEPVVPAPPTRVGAVFCVAAVRAPAGLAVDADLGEWRSLGDAPAGKPCGSRLAFALTNDALVIAAELDEASREGILFGLAAPPADVPPIGSMIGSWTVDPFDCENGGFWADGAFLDTHAKPAAEVAAICSRLEARHAKLAADHARRFSKVFRIDREGVRDVSAEDRSLAIEGARVAWRPAASGASLEASLPLAALPRLSAAPLAWLGAWAAAATSPRPEVGPRESKVVFPEPVSFEPYGKLRARVFGALAPMPRAMFVQGIQCGSAGISYQPGDPLHVESMPYGDAGDGARRDTSRVLPRVESLYEKMAALGDVEVGDVHAFVEWLAILRKGELVDLIPPDAEPSCGHYGSWRGVVQRDGALHAFADALAGGAGRPCGPRLGDWFVVAILPDGSHKSLVADTSGGPDECQVMGLMRGGDIPAGVTFASKTFDRFGWRGEVTCFDPDTHVSKRIGLELTYRWSAAKKSYDATWRRVPVAKKK